MTEPLDSVDLDALLELERSHGWGLVVERISQTIEQKRNELESLVIPQKTQGEIAGLRLALRIAGILKDEIQRTFEKKN